MPWKNPMSKKGCKWLRLSVYAILWLIWAVIPIVTLRSLEPEGGPARLLWLTTWWLPLFSLWGSSLVVLCVWMLRSVHRKAGAVIQCLLGILCTVSLGLPSLLLGAVPFFTLNMRSLQQIFPYGNIVDLRRAEREESQEPNIYIIGVDVSDTFLTPAPTPGPARDTGRDPENDGDGGADHDEADRVGLISDTILDVFGDQGVIGRTLKPNDVLIIRTFAGRPSRNAWQDNKGNANQRQWSLRSIKDGELRSHIRDTRASEQPGGADLLEFLNRTVLDELAGRNYHQAKLILFTALQQVEALGRYESRNDRTDEIDRKIRRLARRIRNNGTLAVVAFTAKPSRGDTDIIMQRDLRLPFDRTLRPTAWQSYDLSYFQTRSRLEKRMQLACLYQDVRDDGETIFLKYDASRGNAPLESYVLLDDEVSEVGLGLHVPQISSDPEAGPVGDVNLIVGEDGESFLGLKGPQTTTRQLIVRRNQRSTLPIVLDGGAAPATTFQPELLVEISPRTIYKIPVSILPLENVEDRARVLGVLLFVMKVGTFGLAVYSCYVEYAHLFGQKRRRRFLDPQTWRRRSRVPTSEEDPHVPPR